jgi:hypothetical protein
VARGFQWEAAQQLSDWLYVSEGRRSPPILERCFSVDPIPQIAL